MWNYVGNFIKTFILTFLVTFLFINIVVAFNFYTTLGLPQLGYTQIPYEDYSDRFFGISDFLNAFRTYWSINPVQDGFNAVQNKLIEFMRFVDFKTVLGDAFGLNSSTPDPIWEVISLVSAIFNILVNLPYITILLAYFFVFLIYLIATLIQFILFIFYLFSGYFLTPKTNTQFPITEYVPPSTTGTILTNLFAF